MNGVSLVEVFTAGLLSFLSPWVLILVPGYISLVTGTTAVEKLNAGNLAQVLRKVLTHSLLFILGFSLVFVGLGAAASMLEEFLPWRTSLPYRIFGLFIILLGLHLTGIFKIAFLYRYKRFHKTGKPATAGGALLIGLAFASGWTFCLGPILPTTLRLAASQDTILARIFLLALYSLGLAVPFLLISLGIAWLPGAVIFGGSTLGRRWEEMLSTAVSTWNHCHF